MKGKNKHPHSMFVIVLLLIGGTLGLSWKVLALSPTVSIKIDQQPPFFSPRTTSALVGTVIEWKNRTGEAHTIRADDCVRGASCSFESRMIMPNARFEVKDLRPGEYAYHCGIHPFMRGMLTVRSKSPRVQSADI